MFPGGDAPADKLKDSGVVNKAVDGGHGRHGVLEDLLHRVHYGKTGSRQAKKRSRLQSLDQKRLL